MAARIDQSPIFNQTAFWPGLFLTFVFLWSFLPSNPSCADESGFNNSWPNPSTIAGEEDSARHRFGQLFGVLRRQAPNLLPGLPAPLHGLLSNPNSWARARLQEARSLIDFSDGDDEALSSGGGAVSLLHPVAALITAPPQEQTQAFWLSPDYHHKGFLPFHDAMMLGMGARASPLDGRLRLDFQPFYGQNWTSAQSYYGARLSVGIGPGGTAKPWGKISFGYVSGDSSLMDHGHGFSLHSEWTLAGNFTINAGVRSSEASRGDNFVILRWNLLGD